MSNTIQAILTQHERDRPLGAWAPAQGRLDKKMIISSAPGRAGIIGNPTDMYGGSVISCSVPCRAQCTLIPNDRFVVDVSGECEEINCVGDLQLAQKRHDLAKAVISSFDIDPSSFKYKLQIVSDIPEQAGLAGSTAMVVAIVGCIADLLDLSLTRYELAEMSRKIESETMGIMCGFQDQYMTVFGGINYLDFRGKEKLTQAEDEPFATVEPLSPYIQHLPMVLAHTGIKRNSGVVHRSIRERWEEGEPAVVDGYTRIAELARLGKKALLEGDLERLGELMNENHAIQRDLGGSGPVNEMLIETALQNGALGAKLAGAGCGGTILALTLDPKRMARALSKAGAERVLFVEPVEGLAVERNW